MSMSFAYKGGEGVGIRDFKMFCQRGSEFSTCFVCAGGGGEGKGKGSGSVPLLP